jgi:hypothetical protein
MKIPTLYAAIFLLGIFAVSCGQDPIFFYISTETVPKQSRIGGTPTNMVVFEREYPIDPDDLDYGFKKVPILYVASDWIHWYATSTSGIPQWDLWEYPIPQPIGKVIALAVAGERLYALCRIGDHENTLLQYIERRGNEWKSVQGSYLSIQSIYADDSEDPQLFAGALINPLAIGNIAYALLYLDDTDDTLKPLQVGTAVLTGAVCRNKIYYLCTLGAGIFQVSKDTQNETVVTQLVNSNAMFMSMIKLKNESSTIIAVDRYGILYEVQEDAFLPMCYNNTDSVITVGRLSMSAIALWENTNRNMKKLVIGIQDGLYSSSYTNGYVEFDLTSDGSFDNSSLRREAYTLQTVDDPYRYMTSLGKHPINHLFQAPKEIDPEMTFFASTQTAGLWSYKNRLYNGGWQWNAEE